MAAPANVQAVGESSSARGDITRMLGAAPAPVSVAPVAAVESNRYRLLGVLAPQPASGAARPSTAGVALIAVDGKPARAFAVGSRVDGDMVLQSIARRSASIGPAQGAAGVVLELAPPPVPTTGTLPKASADGQPVAAMPTVPVPAPMPPPPPMQQLQAQQAQPPTEGVVEDEAPTARVRRGGSSNPMNR